MMNENVPKLLFNRPVIYSKDECLVISKNRKDEVDSVQKKMKKLNAEIKKGTKVYTRRVEGAQ